MSIEELIRRLKRIDESDILDFGEDYEGNPVFAIRNVFDSPCQLTLGNISVDDIPEWSEE